MDQILLTLLKNKLLTMPRRSRVSQVDWDKYKEIVQDFIDEDAGKQPFRWLKKIELMSAFGEDSSPRYNAIPLEGLFHYNYVKTWPSARATTSGELENGNLVLYISARAIKEAGYMDQFGYWDFNWVEDRFILNGKVYKPGGDTQVAQAKDKALLFFVILQREDIEESRSLLKRYELGLQGIGEMEVNTTFIVR